MRSPVVRQKIVADHVCQRPQQVEPREPELLQVPKDVTTYRVAERVGFEPTYPLRGKTLSRRPRYDHFGTSPHDRNRESRRNPEL
jgi:hypothetical protein